jgi:Gpi18-like mannosyltransferase
VLVFASFVFRMILGRFNPPMDYDFSVWAHWSRSLRFDPLVDFYEVQVASIPQHLPGMLWILYWSAAFYSALGGNDYFSSEYEFILKLIPNIFNVVACLVIYDIAARHRSARQALFTTASYAFNPAIIYVGAVWGNFDAVSMSIVIVALWVVVRFPDRWLWAVPLVAWAVMIKPPLGAAGLVVLSLPFWRMFSEAGSGLALRRRMTIAAGKCAAISFVFIGVMMMPFGIGYPGMGSRYTILERLDFAFSAFQYRTFGASSMWMLGQGYKGDLIPDNVPIVFGLDAYTIGSGIMLLTIGLTAACVAFVAIKRLPLEPIEVIAWALTVVSLATFVFPTRMHERYLIPAVIASILFLGVASLSIWTVGFATITSLSAFLNQDLILNRWVNILPDAIQIRLLDDGLYWLSVLNLVLTAVVIIVPVVLVARHYVRVMPETMPYQGAAG